MATALEKLQLARKHLKRVQSAWDPPDWADLSLYGFYSLEAAVDAAALHLKLPIMAVHAKRVEVAKTLHTTWGLPDVAELLRDLNEVRKSEAYGDVAAPELDAEDVAAAIEKFVDAVSTLVSPKGGKH